MIKMIIIGFFALGSIGCQQGGGNTQPEDVQHKTVEQLRQEVLNATCNETMKKEFEENIEKFRSRLSEKLFKNQLRNMKASIKC